MTLGTVIFSAGTVVQANMLVHRGSVAPGCRPAAQQPSTIMMVATPPHQCVQKTDSCIPRLASSSRSTKRYLLGPSLHKRQVNLPMRAGADSSNGWDPVAQPSTAEVPQAEAALAAVAQQITNLFPLWVVLAALVGLIQPGLFNWIPSTWITWWVHTPCAEACPPLPPLRALSSLSLTHIPHMSAQMCKKHINLLSHTCTCVLYHKNSFTCKGSHSLTHMSAQ